MLTLYLSVCRTIWESKKKLPLGVAAMLAWLIGWAGAILGMAQVWYTGPIALRVGGWGGKCSFLRLRMMLIWCPSIGDVGEWLAVGFAGLTYPPLRYIEYRKLGR